MEKRLFQVIEQTNHSRFMCCGVWNVERQDDQVDLSKNMLLNYVGFCLTLPLWLAFAVWKVWYLYRTWCGLIDLAHFWHKYIFPFPMNFQMNFCTAKIPRVFFAFEKCDCLALCHTLTNDPIPSSNNTAICLNVGTTRSARHHAPRRVAYLVDVSLAKLQIYLSNKKKSTKRNNKFT